MDLVGLASRWLHIASAVTLLGGVLFARQILANAGQLEAVTRSAGLFLFAIGGLLLSGVYNLLSKGAVPPGYHAIFGIKVLLALHVFAVAFLLGRPGADAAKRIRQMTGIIISGAVILALSAYLRFLTR